MTKKAHVVFMPINLLDKREMLTNLDSDCAGPTVYLFASIIVTLRVMGSAAFSNLSPLPQFPLTTPLRGAEQPVTLGYPCLRGNATLVTGRLRKKRR